MCAKVVCPGSFDPITVGHEDYIKNAAELFGEAVVLVMNNTEKKYLLSAEERYESARLAFEGQSNIKVELCEGFLAEHCKNIGADAIVKGLRTAGDFEYEYMLSRINLELGGIRTVFLPSDSEKSFISSTFVRDLMKYGKDFSPYVPKGSYIYLKKIRVF